MMEYSDRWRARPRPVDRKRVVKTHFVETRDELALAVSLGRSGGIHGHVCLLDVLWYSGGGGVRPVRSKKRSKRRLLAAYHRVPTGSNGVRDARVTPVRRCAVDRATGVA